MKTLGDALAGYFEQNHFGVDGGYGAPWVNFKLGPIPFPLPNTDSRRAAVKYHDLHHLVTGYGTDLRGEFEISAWELGAGCRTYVAAWALNLAGLVGGAALAPVRTWRAFVRGRRSQSLYGRPYVALLALPVEQAVRSVEGTGRTVSAADIFFFVAAFLFGVIIATIGLVVLLSPVTLLLWLTWRSKRAGKLA